LGAKRDQKFAGTIQDNAEPGAKVMYVSALKNQVKLIPFPVVFFLGISTIAATPLLSDVYLTAKFPLLALSLSCFTVYSYFKLKNRALIRSNLISALLLAFLVSLIISGSAAGTNSTRLLWGESGRSNGLITWFLLSIILLLTVEHFGQFKSSKFYESLVVFLTLCDICFLLQHLGLNIFNEKYIYSPMVGFFGNPNFTSAFLGMSFTLTLGLFFFNPRAKVFNASLSILSLVEIYLTGSFQGLMLAGSGLVFYIYIFGLQKGVSKVISRVFLVAATSSFILGLLGLLGVGILGGILERNSFRIRLGYFESAIYMWANHPLSGVGTDSYGDFFREFRPDWLISVIGDGTTSNDAHNIYFNLLATSGFITFVLYLALNAYCIYRGFTALSKGSFDAVLVIALAVTISYQLQSLISINHLGIAIWGWFAMGVVFAKSYLLSAPKRNIFNYPKSKVPGLLHIVVILSLTLVAVTGFMRLGEGIRLKSVAGNIVVGGTQEYKERKFAELASVSGYWIPDVANSMLVQEAFLNIGASEAAETISKATYAQNLDSRDALWALVAIQTRRGNFKEAIALREKLIVKERQSSWVLLDQADSFAEVKNRVKAIEFLNKAKTKKDVDIARVALIQAKIDLIS
jgi:O-antigen ligase